MENTNSNNSNLQNNKKDDLELDKIEKAFRETTISRFNKLLAFSVEGEVTDIILAANCRTFWRYGGQLKELASSSIWTPNELRIVANHLLQGKAFTENEFEEFSLSAELTHQIDIPNFLPATSEKEISDFDHNSSNNPNAYDAYENNTVLAQELKVQRFRASICKEQGLFRIFLRLIPTEMRSFIELNLPEPQLNQISNLSRGLVLVTGSTGQGKSTTISAMLEYINQNRVCHILTLEDPIEFVYRRKKSLFTQREIMSGNRYASDVKDYPTAIREALRQTPDVIMVGEIRDGRTFEAVLTAAESGHLVISAIHTADVMSTLERIISYYPEQESKIITSRLSKALTAIISQRLLPASPTANVERIPIVEILRVVPGVSENLRDPDKIKAISSKMAKGYHPYGMQTFDQHIIELVDKDLITIDTALAYASSPDEVSSTLSRMGKI